MYRFKATQKEKEICEAFKSRMIERKMKVVSKEGIKGKPFWYANREGPRFVKRDGVIYLVGPIKSKSLFNINPPRVINYTYPFFEIKVK